VADGIPHIMLAAVCGKYIQFYAPIVVKSLEKSSPVSFFISCISLYQPAFCSSKTRVLFNYEKYAAKID
jgi:hypothetical protein